MKHVLAFCAVLLLAGCAKHGFMVEIGQGGRIENEAGYGPTSIFTGRIEGPAKMCVPSKSAAKGSPDENWCRSWMDKAPKSLEAQ